MGLADRRHPNPVDTPDQFATILEAHGTRQFHPEEEMRLSDYQRTSSHPIVRPRLLTCCDVADVFRFIQIHFLEQGLVALRAEGYDQF